MYNLFINLSYYIDVNIFYEIIHLNDKKFFFKNIFLVKIYF